MTTLTAITAAINDIISNQKALGGGAAGNREFSSNKPQSSSDRIKAHLPLRDQCHSVSRCHKDWLMVNKEAEPATVLKKQIKYCVLISSG